MNRFSKTEFQLINYLYTREKAAENETGVSLLETELGLQEKDEIKRIREVVFYVEKLEREGVLETDPGFYTESDHMSFTYLNSATELDEVKIRLSEEGRRLITEFMGYGGGGRFMNAYRRVMETPETKNVLITLCVLALVFGILVGYAVGRAF